VSGCSNAAGNGLDPNACVVEPWTVARLLRASVADRRSAPLPVGLVWNTGKLNGRCADRDRRDGPCAPSSFGWAEAGTPSFVDRADVQPWSGVPPWWREPEQGVRPVGRRGDRLVGTCKVGSLSGGRRGVIGRGRARGVAQCSDVVGAPSLRDREVLLGAPGPAAAPPAPAVSNRPSARGERGPQPLAQEALGADRG
jgi:hypothetical protein